MRVHYKIKRAIDETIDKEQVGKTTDLANRVVDEITVHRYVSSSLKRRMATKK
ncbi:BnaC07g03910D [Brassica napus]|uniref:BnaC07g03910D protein n=2 Tax=Brassica TaxID=3705 RepID=A0A078I6F3_BRANA